MSDPTPAPLDMGRGPLRAARTRVLTEPDGVHERKDRRRARERGAVLENRDGWRADRSLGAWLEEGFLVAAAGSGSELLPAAGAP